MDTLLTLRRPIKDVKPRKVNHVKAKKAAPVSRKKSKPAEPLARPAAAGVGSFVALYRELCGAGRGGYHDTLTFAGGAAPALGGGDARRPLVRVVMEVDY